jgi:hypothetical protein
MTISTQILLKVLYLFYVSVRIIEQVYQYSTQILLKVLYSL